MRKSKGYQKGKSYAEGENKTLEQYLGDIDRRFDKRIKEAKRSYEYITKRTTLVGKDLREFCRNRMLWEVRFDNNGDLIPLEKVLAELEKNRNRYKDSQSYKYFKRTVNKDNQRFVYNSGSGNGGYGYVRVPSIKRSNAVWKRFYELFPQYKEHYDEWNNRNGLKLKKVW